MIEANPAIYIPGFDNSTNPPSPISTSGNADRRRIHSGCTLDPASPPCDYSSTGLITGIANSSYNALEASLKKRFSHGISFLASYTYSKSIDDSSTFNLTGSASKPLAGENDLAQNPFDVGAERGRSLFDARHRFVLSYQWSLPFWRQPHGWYQQVLGNWQANGIVTLMTGTPFTVFDGNDFSVQGSAPEISGFFSNRPNVVADPNDGPKTTSAWLNPNAFQRITQDPNSPVQQFGTAGRNISQGPGYAELGLLTVQEHPGDRIQGAAVSSGILQPAEPYQFPSSRQRHELANFQPDSGGPAAQVDAVGIEVQLLRRGGVERGLKSDARGLTPDVLTPTTRSAELRWDQAGPPCGRDRSRRRFPPPSKTTRRRKLQWEKPAQAIPGSA